MDIQEKLVTYGTQYEEKRNKIYASTNNVNKTWTLLPTTRDKDELNIVSMQK